MELITTGFWAHTLDAPAADEKYDWLAANRILIDAANAMNAVCRGGNDPYPGGYSSEFLRRWLHDAANYTGLMYAMAGSACTTR